MKFKSRFKKPTKKYVTKKAKYAPKRNLNTVPRTSVSVGKGFPKRMVMTHKYVETINHYGSAGAATFYKFNCNGMFDPNNSGPGHQPRYFDQMTAIYNHYTVIGSKIKIKVIPSSQNPSPFKVSLSQNDDATQTNNTIDGTVEQSDACSMRLFAGNSTDTIHTMVNKWSAKRTFGGSVLGNDLLQGTVSSNPSENTFWIIGIQALDFVSSVSSYIDVEIEYIAVWDELKDIVPS